MICKAGLSNQEHLYVPQLTLAPLGVPANSDGKLRPMDQNPDGHCLSYTKSMLDYLLMFAGDDRMLALYKRVCRAYWQTYPESIAFYIMEYRKEYDPDSLIGTKYEYLLHEYDDKRSE